MPNELKPCPFCGSKNVTYIPIEDQNFDDHLEGFIMCSGCDFTSDVYLDPEIAAKKWNRRVDDE